jgi:hypothetical protein
VSSSGSGRGGVAGLSDAGLDSSLTEPPLAESSLSGSSSTGSSLIVARCASRGASLCAPLTSPGGGLEFLCSSSLGLMLRSFNLRLAGVATGCSCLIPTMLAGCATIADLESPPDIDGGRSELLGREPTHVLGLTDMLCSRSLVDLRLALSGRGELWAC